MKDRAERSSSSCFNSLSQDLISIQPTTRHTGAALIACHHNEGVTAYGEKSGDLWADGKLMDWCESLALKQTSPSFCGIAPFSLGGPGCPDSSGWKHASVWEWGKDKKYPWEYDAYLSDHKQVKYNWIQANHISSHIRSLCDCILYSHWFVATSELNNQKMILS